MKSSNVDTNNIVYSSIWKMWFFANWLHTGELCCLYPYSPSKDECDKHATDSKNRKKEVCLLNALTMVYEGVVPRIALSSPQSPFQQKMRSLLWSLRPGYPITYKQAAELLGTQKACRAVGQACARNDFAILIPCHRIIGSKDLGGYRWGEKLKRKLLDMEINSS